MSSKKFPTFSQWKQIFKVLKRGEKITLLVLSLLAAGSLCFLIGNFYIANTKPAPAYGGTYTEGVVGQPRFVNPVYGETNDIDRSLINLVFSGLMTYDKNGKLMPDLAKDYSVSDNGKTYTFNLKNNTFWHDGKPLTADDIIFTIKTIQNSDYKSPLRANWLDVDVQKISDKSIAFTLKNPYNSFLENCTLKIIPQHIWQNVSAENFALSSSNLQPIGSGPYQFLNLAQTNTGFISDFNLISNRNYFSKSPYIPSFNFKFFQNNTDLINAANARAINGFTLASFDNNQALAKKEVKQGWAANEKFSAYYFSLPRYFAVFFNNQKNSIFSDQNVRQAMSDAINKDELVKKIINESKTNILSINSPILPDFFGYQQPSNPTVLNISEAQSLLKKSGFKDDGSGNLQKPLNKKPAFQFKSYLKIGSSGKEVVQLQSCLARLDANFAATLNGETNGKYGKGTEKAVTAFQQKYIADAKATGETGAATRQKLNDICLAPAQNSQALKFTLITLNQPQLTEVANLLAGYWRVIGAQVSVNAVDISDLKTIIKNRDYDALLYGQALGAKPDLYPFWHSSQIVDPGLNLSSYQNKDIDQLLQDARQTGDEKVKEQKYEKLQDILLSDAPALFLYNPDYVYWVSQQVQGIDTSKIIDPAKRFENVTNWFIKAKRIWK